ncbi:transcription factor ORG2-like [Olea europaea var. sylvestris]|uniref:transcription factor ORG2-like n=1 Tax=Olea europaea var. sylvestris TaxID=158386 RepID=UPI000C1D36CB|nr:transcription factor ORG2-like [Olea europaea var. sylvestris]
MLAPSPSMFSNMGCFTEDPISSHEHNNMYTETKGLESTSFGENGTNLNFIKAKKLDHNASEHNRRQKMNSLYSSLRSLLPATDQTKKLSIPATVSRVLKYIPELQKEVDGLIQKKELLSITSRKEGFIYHESLRDGSSQSSSTSNVSVRPVGNGEILIQMSSAEVRRISVSEVLKDLEENGMVLLNASTFQSAGMIFYSMHFQMQGNPRLELPILKERLMFSLFERTN